MSIGCAADRPRLIIPPKRKTSATEESFEKWREEFGADDAPSAALEPALPLSAEITQCPYCQEPVDNPSRKLKRMLHYWEQRSCYGHVLRPTDTIAVCQQHRDERSVLPAGQQRGWPCHVDFKALRRRITHPKKRYMRILEDCIICPEQSIYFQSAARQHAEKGKKVLASAHELDRRELFTDIVHTAYVQDPLLPSLDLRNPSMLQKIQPLGACEFVDHVLVPELACMLIQDDMGGKEAGIELAHARQVQNESHKFGVAMYPSDACGPAQNTRRASGSWVGASPKRARQHSMDKNAYTRTLYVQQTLDGMRRSTRIQQVGQHITVESDSEEEKGSAASQTWHQQRLHLPRLHAASERPAPLPGKHNHDI
ncbi:hypothetical protein MVES1_000081 [Malassezia vespertilionis]|uniref:uncharacterized protein n=1 Tax=Malassezia vespertilionis TaxID=2020962 RepID=UPI0024B0DE87|nr:uncharacterized protein MVES1_000081 [Malassezia vespertilionis]WFD04757.1 hypothetical protein MVES1_000081 [Malassezia vespertilionis]